MGTNCPKMSHLSFIQQLLLEILKLHYRRFKTGTSFQNIVSIYSLYWQWKHMQPNGVHLFLSWWEKLFFFIFSIATGTCYFICLKWTYLLTCNSCKFLCKIFFLHFIGKWHWFLPKNLSFYVILREAPYIILIFI